MNERSSPDIERVMLKEAVGAFKRSAHLQLYLPDNLSCFIGHFPDFPLVPGFVQLEWMRVLSVRHFEIRGNLHRVPRAKFLAPLLPNRRFEVDLTLAPGREMEVEFSISEQSDGLGELRLCTKGSLYFECLA